MSKTNDPLSELLAYRDTMLTVESSTYSNAYIDGLNMAIFLVRAAVHRETLERTFRIEFDDVTGTAKAVAK